MYASYYAISVLRVRDADDIACTYHEFHSIGMRACRAPNHTTSGILSHSRTFRTSTLQRVFVLKNSKCRKINVTVDEMS